MIISFKCLNNVEPTAFGHSMTIRVRVTWWCSSKWQGIKITGDQNIMYTFYTVTPGY